MMRAAGLALLLASFQEPSPGEQPPPTLEGEATIGLRLREIGGSSAQFDEDLNLEEGLFLRAARVRASGLVEGPLESLELSAEGPGDPFASYRLEALGGPWRTNARFDRDRYVGNAQADQHAFDLERERGTLSFEYRPADSSTRSSIYLEQMERDGLYAGSRSFNLDFLTGFPVLREETTRAVAGTLATEAAGWELDLGLGLVLLDTEDDVSFAVPPPGFPNETASEDFASETEALGRNGVLELERELGSGARLTLDFEWHFTDLDGDLSLFERGFFFDPSLPFERTTVGDLEIEVSELEGGAGISFPISEDAQLDLRYSRTVERERGDLARTVVLEEFTGEPETVTTFPDQSELDSELDLLELDAEAQLTELVHLDLLLEWGREELDVLQVRDGTTVRQFDDTLDELGAEAGASIHLERDLVLDLGAGHRVRPTESAELGARFDLANDRTTFGRARCSWRGERRSLSAEARLEHRESNALTSEGDYGRYGLSYAGRIGERTSFDALASFVTHDLESETTFLFFDPVGGIVSVPAVATFEGRQLVLSGQVERAFEELRPRLSWNLVLGQGDGEFDYHAGAAALPWEFRPGFELGIAARALDFDGSGALDASDYHAFLLELYVRLASGPRPF